MRAHEFITNLFEASYDSMIAAMKRKYPSSNWTHNEIDWGKQLKRQDRVVWYLRILDQFLSEPEDDDIPMSMILAGYPILGNSANFQQFKERLWHFLGQDIPKIQSYVFNRQPATQVFDDLEKIETEYKEKQGKNRGVIPFAGDYKLIRFQDGSNWWYIDRAYCPEEGRSGMHCGNVVGKQKTNQRILSYRDKNNRVIMTFILEPNGTLGEMKAKGNLKPDDKYHPMIMQLLLNPMIKGITGMGYLPDMNFNVFDLDDKYLQILRQNKPNLITDQIKVSPYDILRAPDWVKQEYVNDITDENLKNLILDNSIDNWVKAVKNDPNLILVAPDNYPDYRDKLIHFLTDNTRSRFIYNLLKVRSKYRNDFDFLSELISKSFNYINAVPETYRRISELNEIAVDKNPDRIRLIKDKDYLTQKIADIAFSHNRSLIEYIPDRFKTLDMCEKAIDYNPFLFRYVPDRYKTTEFCQVALDRKPMEIYYMIPDRIKTPEFNLKFAQDHPYAAIRALNPKDATTKIRLIFLKHDRRYFLKINMDDQTPEMIKYLGSEGLEEYIKYIRADLVTERLVYDLITNSGGLFIEYVPDAVMTPKLALLSVKSHPPAVLRHIPASLVTPTICRYSVVNNFINLIHIAEYSYLKKFLTYKLCYLAVKTHGGDNEKNLEYYISRCPQKYRAKLTKELIDNEST